MSDYTKLVEALRMGADYGVEEESVGKLCADAAAAIEELQAEVNGLIADAGARIGKAEAERPHWVSVKQPPVVGQHIMVMDENEDMFTASYDGNGVYEDEYGFFMEGILYWMPLPEPPKEDA